jgi:hypothetical protein
LCLVLCEIFFMYESLNLVNVMKTLP